LLRIPARVDAEEGIRQGLEDAKKRKIRPAKDFFDEFEAEHGYVVKIASRAGREFRRKSPDVGREKFG